ncbi:hypothetical protein PGT21_007445 [Puccinia graminis f. sp. tritici]|uniref:Uncharacterized protein n=1 Tax=Puccinia graminis f. sp. tritici TaxID=56615 RepID=A0A5B0MHL5_PUCGR|nr:hypothetical protein PGT21_007445 [Puccinia graminis f. sp. tritici]KAA1135518.1 hypothetical protein PGTUg99_011063 [Puccinia graminis f. sp. tritici]
MHFVVSDGRRKREGVILGRIAIIRKKAVKLTSIVVGMDRTLQVSLRVQQSSNLIRGSTKPPSRPSSIQWLETSTAARAVFILCLSFRTSFQSAGANLRAENLDQPTSKEKSGLKFNSNQELRIGQVLFEPLVCLLDAWGRLIH